MTAAPTVDKNFWAKTRRLSLLIAGKAPMERVLVTATTVSNLLDYIKAAAEEESMPDAPSDTNDAESLRAFFELLNNRMARSKRTGARVITFSSKTASKLVSIATMWRSSVEQARIEAAEKAAALAVERTEESENRARLAEGRALKAQKKMEQHEDRCILMGRERDRFESERDRAQYALSALRANVEEERRRRGEVGSQ